MEKNFDKSKKNFKKPGIDIMAETMAKLPPQALDLEVAVLGTLLIYPTSYLNIADILSERVFYENKHRLIFKAIEFLNKESLPVDSLTVANKLKELEALDSVGGYYYIGTLTNNIYYPSNIEYHARILVQQYLKRSLIDISNNTQKLAYDDSTDVFDLIDNLNTASSKLSTNTVKGKEKSSTKFFKETLNYLEEILNLEDGVVTGFPTGFRNVDKMINGFKPGNFIILAARPAQGKSSLLKDFLKGGSDVIRKPILLFSHEMTTQEHSLRLLSEELNVSYKDLTKKSSLKDIGFDKIMNAASKFMAEDPKDDLWIIDDTPSLTINELKARAKKIKDERDISAIGIDYLQLLSGHGDEGTREQEVSRISRGLKALAKELDIPVIALSQLSRKCEETADKRPQLSHLRESGSLEQDADLVMFLFRPEYYFNEGNKQFETYEHCETKQIISCKDYAELIVAKNRGGETGILPLRFNGRVTTFKDWNDQSQDFNDVKLYNSTNSALSKITGANEFDTPSKNDEPPF